MSSRNPIADIGRPENPETSAGSQPDVLGGHSSLGEGLACIHQAIVTLPECPGVYRMIGGDQGVLYIGKARQLRQRVQNYTRTTGQPRRILRMIALTRSMEFITTETEPEALLLEANLIKTLKPRFNVLLQDDKSFPFILIARDHQAPVLIKHRGARDRPGDYFGPFAATGAVNRTVDTLQQAFLLRNCTDSAYEGRTRPCLQYQIKRCAAPCTGEISLERYGDLVNEATDFLAGRSQNIKQELATRMEAAARKLNYEEAARLRDRIAALSRVQTGTGLVPRQLEEADIFALHQEGGQTCLQVFFFRNWQNWGNRAYFPKTPESVTPAEILSSFVAQFYVKRIPPRLILLSDLPEDKALLSRSLSKQAGSTIECQIPTRGEKANLVRRARDNAVSALARKMGNAETHNTLLHALTTALALPAVPNRIEVYDNSHIVGKSAVGSMIVVGEEGFEKKQYRTFKISPDTVQAGDDFAMMRQVLTRRFHRAAREIKSEENKFAATNPDLLILDGGAGQLSQAVSVLTSFGLTALPVIAVSKGDDRDSGQERIHRPGRPPLLLPLRDPILYFIQRMRDEAHRFAIHTHRRSRGKTMSRSKLDDIDGIGPARKRALLRQFGSVDSIRRAGVKELKAVPGISGTLAKIIYSQFHGDPIG